MLPMLFDPARGTRNPLITDPSAWRAAFPKHIWYVDPWTGKLRPCADMVYDPFGLMFHEERIAA